MRDAAVEVAGSRPRSGGAVDEHHGRRGAGRNETLGYVLRAPMLHSAYSALSKMTPSLSTSADTNTHHSNPKSSTLSANRVIYSSPWITRPTTGNCPTRTEQ